MEKGVRGLVVGFVLVVIFVSVGVVMFFGVSESVVGGGLRTSSYTTSKSCDKFLLGIGDVSKGLPFTWQYNKNTYRCVQSYQSKRNGCKVAYTSSACQESMSVPVSVIDAVPLSYSDWGVGCQSWVEKEKYNFNGLCRGGYQLVKLEDVMESYKGRAQKRCVLTYVKGCSVQSRCRLFYGNGNPNNRNIVVTADKDNEQLSLVTAGIVAYTLRSHYPFKDYADRFNVYIINNVSVDHAFDYWENSDVRDISSVCGISFPDVVVPSKSYLVECGRGELACMWSFTTSYGMGSKIDITSNFYGGGGSSNYAHELMHSGGAVGESYDKNPQMWEDFSVANVIKWILRK